MLGLGDCVSSCQSLCQQSFGDFSSHYFMDASALATCQAGCAEECSGSGATSVVGQSLPFYKTTLGQIVIGVGALGVLGAIAFALSKRKA